MCVCVVTRCERKTPHCLESSRQLQKNNNNNNKLRTHPGKKLKKSSAASDNFDGFIYIQAAGGWQRLMVKGEKKEIRQHIRITCRWRKTISRLSRLSFSLSSAVLATKTTPKFVLAISFLSFFLYFMSLLLLNASVVISFPHFI